MELKIDAKFEGKMTCAFKNDIRNLASELNKFTSYGIEQYKMLFWLEGEISHTSSYFTC